MLLISFGGQSAAAFIGAVAYWVQTSSSTAGVVGTVSLFIFISIYGLGVAAIPCMYLAEIFPQNFKGFGMVRHKEEYLKYIQNEQKIIIVYERNYLSINAASQTLTVDFSPKLLRGNFKHKILLILFALTIM